jgi:hypothetical protein
MNEFCDQFGFVKGQEIRKSTCAVNVNLILKDMVMNRFCFEGIICI